MSGFVLKVPELKTMVYISVLMDNGLKRDNVCHGAKAKNAGVHEIALSMRGDGFEFDCFLLTNEREYIPRGIGPKVNSASGNLPEPFPVWGR